MKRSKVTEAPSLAQVAQAVVNCERCVRLRRYCQAVGQEKRRAFQSWDYWTKPIPGFGVPDARLWIVGLAPAAHGANRTGRIFTGDQSGLWLYRALHRAGFANQALAESRDDGLKLQDTYISCVVRCAPPDNEPLPEEKKRCQPYLAQEWAALRPRSQVIIALGQIALQGLWSVVGEGRSRPRFGHGVEVELPAGPRLLLSYHPSQQNTFTKRLTEPMFDSIFARAREILKNS